MQTLSPEKKPEYIEIQASDGAAELICQRRAWEPWLLEELISKNAISVSVARIAPKGSIKLEFKMAGRITHSCCLNGRTITFDDVRDGPWVWSNPVSDGFCLVVDHPIDFFEIVAVEDWILPCLSIVIAGAEPDYLATLIATGKLKNTLLLCSRCYSTRRISLHPIAAIHHVKLLQTSPAPFQDWAEARDKALKANDDRAWDILTKLEKTLLGILFKIAPTVPVEQ
jgi:hypothetical protein